MRKPFGYKYPHDYPGSYVVQQYLPDELKIESITSLKTIDMKKCLK